MLDTYNSLESVNSALVRCNWRGHFDEGALFRGQAYAVRERASHVTVGERGAAWVIEAKVRGSRATPYQTKITVPFPGEDEDFMADCSCPLGGDCKHAVAVVETVLALAKRGLRPVPVDRSPVVKAEPALSVPLRRWIDDALVPDGAPVVPTRKAEVSRVLRFSFHLSPHRSPVRGHVARLTLMSFAQGRKGLDKAMAVSLRGGQKGEYPAYFTEEDLRLAQEIDQLSTKFADGGFHMTEMEPSGRFWGLLIRDLLATGRAIWGEDPQAVLSEGPERILEPCWTADASGQDGDLLTSIRFQDTGQRGVLLGTTPELYIDPETRMVGRVQWQGSVDPVRWLDAPPVPAAHVGRVCERMSKAGWAPSLRPLKLEIQDLLPEEAPLTPRLVLTRMPVQRAINSRAHQAWGMRKDRLNLPVAQFQVRYGAVSVVNPVADRSRQSTQVTSDAILRVTRDLDREEQFLSFLSSLDLYPVAKLFGSQPADGGTWQSAYTLAGEEVLDSGGSEDWYSFLGLLPALRALGWEIEIRPDFGYELAEANDWWTELEEGGTQDWFRFDAGVEVEGRRVSLLGALREMAERLDADQVAGLLAAEETAVVPLRLPEAGIVLAFPARRLGQLLSCLLQLFEAAAGDGTMVHKLAAARLAVLLPEMAGETARALRKLGEALSDFHGVVRVKTPRTLKATLRPYQTDGLSWIQFLRGHGLSGILADDMGLGKTVQTLAHLLVERGAKRLDRPCLIVAPTSVVSNWAAEAARFAPSLRVLVLQGPERKELFARIPQHDLVLTSFALLPRDEEEIRAHDYHYVILDEAQYIKNPASKMAQAACGLRTRHRLCLSGTPLENHLGELWSLFHFLMPGFLGDQDAFRKNWRRPIESGEDDHRRELLAKRVAPLMLRRTRGQVLQELPPRTDIVRSVPLNRAQAELYEVVRAAMDKRVRDAISAKGLAQSQIIVLDALLKLRQICCDPRLLKLPAARKVKESAKLDSFRELVTGLVEEGRRILVFSQFTSMLAILEKCLDKEHISSLMLTGDTPGVERAKLVNAFQSGEAPVFFISLKAGGSGLNLTTADTVIHYDPWWNPAVEEQATGRAHRMGQANPVFVYRLITEGTIEERILELQSRKAAIASAILEGGSSEPGRGLAIERGDLERLLAPI